MPQQQLQGMMPGSNPMDLLQMQQMQQMQQMFQSMGQKWDSHFDMIDIGSYLYCRNYINLISYVS